ncbi:hypothetical protein ACHAW6_001867 [Cyclotella cf. meneghiniana]
MSCIEIPIDHLKGISVIGSFNILCDWHHSFVLNHGTHAKLSVDVILFQKPPTDSMFLHIWNGAWRHHWLRFVIDWYHLGDTMFDTIETHRLLSSKKHHKSLFQHLYRDMDALWHPLADALQCATLAMDGWLGENFGIYKRHSRVTTI